MPVEYEGNREEESRELVEEMQRRAKERRKKEPRENRTWSVLILAGFAMTFAVIRYWSEDYLPYIIVAIIVIAYLLLRDSFGRPRLLSDYEHRQILYRTILKYQSMNFITQGSFNQRQESSSKIRFDNGEPTKKMIGFKIVDRVNQTHYYIGVLDPYEPGDFWGPIHIDRPFDPLDQKHSDIIYEAPPEIMFQRKANKYLESNRGWK